jgi:hypothetical protein
MSGMQSSNETPAPDVSLHELIREVRELKVRRCNVRHEDFVRGNNGLPIINVQAKGPITRGTCSGQDIWYNAACLHYLEDRKNKDPITSLAEALLATIVIQTDQRAELENSLSCYLAETSQDKRSCLDADFEDARCENRQGTQVEANRAAAPFITKHRKMADIIDNFRSLVLRVAEQVLQPAVTV